MGKDSKIKTAVMMALVFAVVVVSAQFSGLMDVSYISADEIYAQPIFGNLKCATEGTYRYTDTFIGCDAIDCTYTYTCAKFLDSTNYADAPECIIDLKLNQVVVGEAELYKIGVDGSRTHVPTQYTLTLDRWVEVIRLKQGEKVEINMHGHFLNKWYKGDLSLRSGFQPYHLVDTGTGAAMTKIKDDCWFTSEIDSFNLPKLCEGSACLVSGYPGRIGYNEWVNYVSLWVLSPIEGNVIDYNGKDVMCTPFGSSFGLYELSEFENIMGEKRKFLDMSNPPIKIVDCCPKAFYCTDDFQLIEDPADIVDKECGIFNPCLSGWISHPTVYGKVVMYDCVNNKCVITQTKDNGCLNCDGICDKDYNCVSAEPPLPVVDDPVVDDEKDYTSLLILGGIAFMGFLFMLVIIGVALHLRKK